MTTTDYCGRHNCRHHRSEHGQLGCIKCPMKPNGDFGCYEFHEAASATLEAYCT